MLAQTHEMSHTDACLALFAKGDDRTWPVVRPVIAW